jgi:heterodisulfide reductase subunit A
MAKKKRTGVFVCRCGSNIAASVDCDKVAEEVAEYPGVVHTSDVIYMCSDPGQSAMADDIKEKELDSVVVACCSPTLHETTFRNVTVESGLDSEECVIANIREQCAWVHAGDREKATNKAIQITKSAVEKARRNTSLEPISVPVTKKALVIGGGIAGVQTALDIAAAGIEVVMVERQASIGGHMIQISETFPTLDCSQCILSPKMVELSKNKNITLHVLSEVQGISGSVGNFTVNIHKKPSYVHPDLCKICDDCTAVCPTVVSHEEEMGLVDRRAIYIPYAQAIPASFTLDIDACLGLDPIACGNCFDVCEAGAIDYDMQPQEIVEEVGAVVVATGFDLYGKENLGEYGHGYYEDVLDGLQFERLCSASGPTEGSIMRPSDHKEPKSIVFIQCAGSRDPEKHCSYCSKICCMYTAKHAQLYRHKVHDGQAYVFYIDIRSGGKGYEEFVQRVVEKDGVVYLRGKVSKVYQEDGNMIVQGVDTLSGMAVEIEAEMVVLATAMQPSFGTDKLAKTLKLSQDKDGFLSEAHPKLRPVECVTAGMFLAGTAQGPKDIPETVAQASAAAAKAIILLSKDKLYQSPTVAKVRLSHCTGCGMCVDVCPYSAISYRQNGQVEVNEVLCTGCGTCSATCLRDAIGVANFSQGQVHDMICAALGV